MRTFLADFQAFVNRGNFVEIAVAFVMGAAFGAVTTALTDRIVSPLVGMVVDVPAMAGMWTFGPVDPETGVPQGSVGAFVEALLNFIIIAFVMFLVVRVYNRFRDREDTPDPRELVVLREIRDELRAQQTTT